MERKLTYEISDDFDGKTVKELLKHNKISVAMTTKLKKKDNGIMLNGQRVFVTAKLSKGDILELLTESEEAFSEFIYPTEGYLDIIYEDEDFLVINKPPYLPVHPSKGHPYDSLANIVAYYYKQKNHILKIMNELIQEGSMTEKERDLFIQILTPKMNKK